nr:hypothetical protein [Tanacetum cinerariifolium]
MISLHRTITGYAGNPNNNNGWLKANDYLLGELEAMVDEPMVVPAIEEVTEPVAEAAEEHIVTLPFLHIAAEANPGHRYAVYSMMDTAYIMSERYSLDFFI